MTATLPGFDAHDKTEEIAATLAETGAVIVNEVIDPKLIDRLNAVIQPALDRRKFGGNTFMGKRYRSVGRLYERSPEFAEHLLLNSVILGVADEILNPEIKMGPNASGATHETTEPVAFAQSESRLDELVGDGHTFGCHHYKLNVSGSSEILGGGNHQPLHRENDIYAPYIKHDPTQPEYICFNNVASSDFRVENGATRLVPGSHKWPIERKAEEPEVAQAIMPKGSIVIWLGKTLHGLGASVEDEPRKSYGVSLVVDWLATEENQHVATSAETAQELPERAQQLLGFRASPSLGWVGGFDVNNLLKRAS